MTLCCPFSEIRMIGMPLFKSNDFQGHACFAGVAGGFGIGWVKRGCPTFLIRIIHATEDAEIAEPC